MLCWQKCPEREYLTGESDPSLLTHAHKRTDPEPAKICMAPFISTHKLKPAQRLNHGSCNRLFRYRLMPHILKGKAFPELAGNGDFSDGIELRGKQDHKCILLRTHCRFLHFSGVEESSNFFLCKHYSPFWEELHLFPPPQMQSIYLGRLFPCHFPFPPIAWVCSLQLGNPCDTFHWQTPELDAEELNLFIQPPKMANFLCTCFGIPQLDKALLRVWTELEGFLFFFSLFTSIPTPAAKKGLGWSV